MRSLCIAASLSLLFSLPSPLQPSTFRGSHAPIFSPGRPRMARGTFRCMNISTSKPAMRDRMPLHSISGWYRMICRTKHLAQDPPVTSNTPM